MKGFNINIEVMKQYKIFYLPEQHESLYTRVSPVKSTEHFLINDSENKTTISLKTNMSASDSGHKETDSMELI